jgi:DNA repair exonuclease SbcCD nuclease subunit
MLKVLQTGDVHLGMTHRSRNYPDPVRQQLIDARFNTLARLVDHANEEQCHLFLVTGDLFHRTLVSEAIIKKTVDILHKFQGNCVAVLPGNHDFDDGIGRLWTTFRDYAKEEIILLTETQPYHLDEYGLDAVLYPGPCHRQHSGENRLAWIKNLTQRPQATWHLGAAHGALSGVSPDFDQQYFPMTEDELRRLAMNHWFLGHTHIRYPDLDEVQDTIFTYNGTPEPDGFDCSHGGYAWIVELNPDGSKRCRSLPAGTFRFRDLAWDVKNEEDLLRHTAELTTHGEKTLVKLRLKGSLPREAYAIRGRIMQQLDESLFYLEWDDQGLIMEITAKDIGEEFSEGSLPYLLLSRLEEQGKNEALQLAYQLIKEVRQ